MESTGARILKANKEIAKDKEINQLIEWQQLIDNTEAVKQRLEKLKKKTLTKLLKPKPGEEPAALSVAAPAFNTGDVVLVVKESVLQSIFGKLAMVLN
eukprot:10832740-Heterocapsa_arctica.AAC.1